MSRPLILYVPGLNPKPEPGVHRQQLLRCLRAGLMAADSNVAADFAGADGAFDVVSWTFDFYGEHRDIAQDMPCIDGLLAKTSADDADRAEAASWRRRFLRTVYRIGDRLPLLIPQLANETVALHLRDLRRYVKNENDVAENTRRHLKMPLRAAIAAGRPVLLLAHSMGSVIAWDALWQLGRDPNFTGDVSLFMTLGSPLGQRYLQTRLLGSRESGVHRYPEIVQRWINVAAIGELTALNRELAGDFSGTPGDGGPALLEDIEVYNWYRDHGTLNVHAEYGYLANPDCVQPVASWWLGQRRERKKGPVAAP